MIPGVNRRIHPRKVLRGPTTIAVPGQPPREGKCWDVGLDGMSVVCAKPIPPSTRCELRFDVPAGEHSVTIRALAKVLYCSYCGAEGFKVGIAFVEPQAESLEAVRRFAAA
jgi:hypothetical protein